MGRPPRASTSGKACATKSGGWRNRCAPCLGGCRRERHTLSAQRHFPDALSERTGEHGMTAGIFSSSLHYPRCISACSLLVVTRFTTTRLQCEYRLPEEDFTNRPDALLTVGRGADALDCHLIHRRI